MTVSRKNKKKPVVKFDLLSFLDKSKKIIIAFISLAILVLVVFYLVKSSLDKKMSIMPFSVPKIVADLGYTDIVCSQIYFDEIKHVSSSAKTIYARKEYSTYEKEIDFNIPFVDKEISIGSAKTLLQRVFNIRQNKITGDLSLQGNDSIILTTRYNSDKPVIVSGKIKDLRNIIKQSVEDQFKNFNPYILASYLESEGNDIKSVQVLKNVISGNSSDISKWAYNLWGTILMKHKLYEEARKKFRKSQSVDSLFFLPYYNLGQLEKIDSNYLEAKKYYHKSIALNKKFEKSYIQMALVCLATHEYKSAEKNIDTAILINSKNGDVYFARAQLFLELKDTLNAIELIDKAIELNDNKAEYYVLLAGIKQMQNNNASAEQLYSKAYHLDKNDLTLAFLYKNSMLLNGDTALANSFKKNVVDSLGIAKMFEILMNERTREILIH